MAGSLALLGGSTALFVFGNVLLIAWALKQAWTYLVVPAQIGRLYRQQPGFQVAVSYRVDATGLNIGSPTGETHLPWDRMLRWKRGRSAVLLYHSAQVFNFLPTRLLSDRDLDDLVVLLKAHRVIEERPRYRQARPWLQALAPLLLSVAVLVGDLQCLADRARERLRTRVLADGQLVVRRQRREPPEGMCRGECARCRLSLRSPVGTSWPPTGSLPVAVRISSSSGW